MYGLWTIGKIEDSFEDAMKNKQLGFTSKNLNVHTI